MKARTTRLSAAYSADNTYSPPGDYLAKNNILSDLASRLVARTNLGLAWETICNEQRSSVATLDMIDLRAYRRLRGKISVRPSAASAINFRVSDNIITLKQLCTELKLDSRETRERLRSAARDPKKAKMHKRHAPWSWVKGSAGEKEARTTLRLEPLVKKLSADPSVRVGFEFAFSLLN